MKNSQQTQPRKVIYGFLKREHHDKRNDWLFYLTELKKHLIAKGEPGDIANIVLTIEAGSDIKRRQAVAEVEAYIEKTAMPEILRAHARKEAYNSVSQHEIDTLEKLISRCPDNLTATDLCIDENGNMAFSEAFIDRHDEKITYVFSEEDERLYGKLEALFLSLIELSDDIRLSEFFQHRRFEKEALEYLPEVFLSCKINRKKQ